MLSQDDQRRLGDIERQISLSDPGFAEGLRDGTPHRPTDDRRWPLVVWALGAVILLLIALLVVSPFLIALSFAGVASAALAYRHHVRKVHGYVRRVAWWKPW